MNSINSLKKVEKLYDERITSSNDAVKAAGQWGSNEYVPLICDEIYKKVKIKKSHKLFRILSKPDRILRNYKKKHFRRQSK